MAQLLEQEGFSFRPLTGPTISQYFLEMVENFGLDCFRPLTGPTISQYPSRQHVVWDKITVSVPLRGLLFLNEL